MNHEYLHQILEEVQKDLADIEQNVSELQGMERYVQRKMESDSDEGNAKLTYEEYQSLLEDVRQDVDGARSKIGELRGVGNFAREKLKAIGVDVGELKASEPVTTVEPSKSAAKPDSATKAEPKAAAKSPLAQPGKVETMQTVQFGPDGFPISN